MTVENPIISVITDEIAPSLDDVLAFAAEERLTHLEVRQVDGTNVLMMTADALATAAGRIRDAGLTVSALATPLLKWPAPGRPFAMVGDTFGFDPRSKDLAGHMAAAAEAARAFGTRRLRIFSYLTAPDFRIDELAAALRQMLDVADAHGLELMLENEPVCNVQRVDQLLTVLETVAHPRLKALLDLGNLAAVGAARLPDEIARLMPFVDYMHVKDWSSTTRRPVPLGDGDIGFQAFLADCLVNAGARQLTLSIETHVPQNRVEATRCSLRALRATVARIMDDPGRVRREAAPYATAGAAQ